MGATCASTLGAARRHPSTAAPTTAATDIDTGAAAAAGLPRRRFVPHDGVPGQGAAAAAEFAKLRIAPGDLAALYACFTAMDAKRAGLVELPAFYRFMRLAPSPYTERLFHLFDLGGDGAIDFHEFVVAVWNYAVLDASALTRFAHMLYDTGATGFLRPGDLEDMVRQMWGDGYASNPRVMRLFAEAGVASGGGGGGGGGGGAPPAHAAGAIPFDVFARVTRGFPYLLLPAFQLQAAVRRAVLGEGFWAALFAERARRGTAARYSVWDVLAAMKEAAVEPGGAEEAVALRGRYVPPHLLGHPGVAAASQLAEDPVAAGAAARAALGLPPAAGDAAATVAAALGGPPPTAAAAAGVVASGAGAGRAWPPAAPGVEVVLVEGGGGGGEGGRGGVGPLAGVRTLRGGAARARRGSRVANVQERAARMAAGR